MRRWRLADHRYEASTNWWASLQQPAVEVSLAHVGQCSYDSRRSNTIEVESETESQRTVYSACYRIDRLTERQREMPLWMPGPGGRHWDETLVIRPDYSVP